MNCPICSKETLHKYRPFCSKRCADIDLSRWMTGAYAVPSQSEEDTEELERELEKAVEQLETPPQKLH
jgi:endogenous inhibitor of DNA gyrase (YacG/DUF329 family)